MSKKLKSSLYSLYWMRSLEAYSVYSLAAIMLIDWDHIDRTDEGRRIVQVTVGNFSMTSNLKVTLKFVSKNAQVCHCKHCCTTAYVNIYCKWVST